jgi:hypothetical protein
MPLQVFIVLVFGICCWLAIAVIEPVMQSFAAEAGMTSWLFIAIPGLLAMLFAVLSYVRATQLVTSMDKSMSRALLVALATWIAVTGLIAWLWCPTQGTLRCTSNVLLMTGIIGGGPLLIGAMVAGGVVGLVLRRRPAWITFDNGPKRIIDGGPEAAPVSPLDATTINAD